MVSNELLSYFKGDMMAASVWLDKYALKNKEGQILENTPDDMHRRMAKEFARVEYRYRPLEESTSREKLDDLSVFGKKLFANRLNNTQEEITEEFYNYFKDFKYIVPQGSIMSNLGNPYVIGSLSNCFTVESPYDSYGGIFHTDQEIGQLMKRRGGVGTLLDTLRPTGMTVTNAARSTSGVPSFAERYSNTTREVALDGRRGALMLLLSVKHPDIFRFITSKKDRTKITGANISVKFTNKFMEAVESNSDFYCTFPVDSKLPEDYQEDISHFEYNKLISTLDRYGIPTSIMRIKANELFDEFITMAHDNAEPGAAYGDTIIDYSPDSVYELFFPDRCNPCGEQWFSANETCRLISQNFFSLVLNPFTNRAAIDYDKLYEVSYIQQRLGDNLVDLEIEHIDKIIAKIKHDPEPDSIKDVELRLWYKVREKALLGRRTGSGFTALGDMIAALGKRYCSDMTINMVDSVMYVKMKAELDATIDMAILRGAFPVCDTNKEFTRYGEYFKGSNSFYEFIVTTFTEQARKMFKYGHRNVNWSNLAPGGTVSVMTQSTSSGEPLFKGYHIRRVKIIGDDGTKRVDFVDQNGDKWTEYVVIHPKFKDWIIHCILNNVTANDVPLIDIKRDMDNQISTDMFTYMSRQVVEAWFKQSPWYGSEANDLDWEYRIKMQATIQKYTSNAISSTINLPNNVSKDVVKNIYIQAWKQKLKGVTIYRDGSRTGVLITESVSKANVEQFGYADAPKRPKELEAHYYYETYKGNQYAVIIGLLEGNPYEIFIYENPKFKDRTVGTVIKRGTGSYDFVSATVEITNLGLDSKYPDETMLTRWVSMMLRHRVSPRFIAEQVEKSKVSIVNFSKVLVRVLKSYILEEVAVKESCPSCSQQTMVRQEGCIKCASCGYSRC